MGSAFKRGEMVRVQFGRELGWASFMVENRDLAGGSHCGDMERLSKAREKAHFGAVVFEV